MIRIGFILIFMGLATIGSAQEVKWTSFDNLNDSLRLEKRPLLIFIEAEWCKYCKMQLNTTFKDADVVKTVYNSFYALRLDGESRETIKFLNRSYKYNPSTGHHELAEYLGKHNGELVYPTTVLLNGQFQLTQRLQGMVDDKTLMSIIIK